MTNIREFKRPEGRKAKATADAAYELGHGHIGKQPTQDAVNAQSMLAHILAAYISDQIGTDEALVDNIDVLDALATMGAKIVELSEGEPSLASWAYWHEMGGQSNGV